MRRTVLFLAGVASAAAFSASPVALRGAPAARSVARPGATSVRMLDASAAELAIASLPGLAALGLSLQANQASGTLRCLRWLRCRPPLSAPPIAMAERRSRVHLPDHGLAYIALARTGPAPATPTPASPADVLPTARANFKRWNDALQTKNPLTVANMYSTSELSFLPTVSPQHIKGIPNTEDYFKDFVLKNPFGTITDDSVQVFDGGNAYLHSGMYTFELGDAGARTPVSARFSYVWRSYNGDWKITHHHSSVTPAAPDMKQVARDNFQAWNDALQTKDPKKVAALYSDKDLSFLPTVSPQHIKVIPDTKDYFTDFVLKNPFGTITDDKVQVFDNGSSYLHSGMYTFELGDAGARTPVEARFSYVWRKEEGDWKIAHHHSSVTPPAPADKAAAAAGKEAAVAK